MENVACSMKINPETIVGKILVRLLTARWRRSVAWKRSCFASGAVLLACLL